MWESGVTLDMWHIYLAAKRCIFSSLPALFFEGVTVGINEGDRIGIVGRNGDGNPHS